MVRFHLPQVYLIEANEYVGFTPASPQVNSKSFSVEYSEVEIQKVLPVSHGNQYK